MIKSIIFDFDGVIHDTIKLQFEMYKKFVGNVSLSEYKDLYSGSILHKTKIKEEDQAAFADLEKSNYRMLKTEQGIRAELLKISSKYSMFVITSNQEKAINYYFENNGILDIFEKVLGRETHRSKVEKFKMIFAKYGLNKDNCVFVTDTLGDILEANKLDIKTIAVDFGYHERERLLQGNPLRIISNFSDLLPVVEKINQ